MNPKPTILVVGSSNVDMVTKVEHLPKPGETIGNAQFVQVYGGKGANQAIAAKRLGAEVIFVTSLGDDVYGPAMKEHFRREGLNVEYLLEKECNSGVAVIFVDSRGENCIAVAPGANAELMPDAIPSFEEVLGRVEVLLMQAEIPHQTISDMAHKARERGVKVILNPAPAYNIDEATLQSVDLLIVNQTEAELISKLSIDACTLEKVAARLREMGARAVIVTLGSEGVYALCPECEYRLPAYRVDTIDTTAAGDTFCGAVAVSIATGKLDEQALQFACAAAAISTTRLGAQPSIPALEEVSKFLKTNLNNKTSYEKTFNTNDPMLVFECAMGSNKS